MGTLPKTTLSPLQLAIVQALQSKTTPQRNALADQISQPKPTTNALSGLLGLASPPKLNALGMLGSSYRGGLLSPGALALLGGIGPKTRHVFHSFHYADVRRVNQIRMCDQLRKPGFAELVQLSEGARSYDWVADNGVRNLIHWTDAAAAAAGK